MDSLVSILIPTYNRAIFLEKCIKSALNQTYGNLEIIISDNCSTDNTEEIVSKYNDTKIRYVKNFRNIGPILNWKNALMKSKGKYCVILCDDDYFIDNEYVQNAINLFTKDNSINLVITDCVLGRKQQVSTNISLKQVTDGKEFLRNFWSKNYHIPVISNVFIREEAMKINAFSNNSILYSDIELWLMLMCNGNVGYINKQSVYYNFHDDNIVTNMDLDTIIDNSRFILNLRLLLIKNNIMNQKDSKKLIYEIVNRYILFVNSIYNFKIDINLYKKILNIIDIHLNYYYYLNLKGKLIKRSVSRKLHKYLN
ncbi:glycosyltransferase [Clostridium sp.]|uniref:glycosyltransferase family 2 protein n=1 Tax=Clostridium sp. TaxID=1506 RepID=UPI001A581164|nr:glycosyltransferase [Clostridium sp.]MBK5240997.1 glycosyltransferase [Clostridium sp.]